MKRIALIFFCLALACVSLSALQKSDDKPATKVDVTGTWKAAVDVAGQTGEPTFTLKQDGDKVTGKYSGSLGEQDVSGKVTGDKIEFGFSIDLGTVVFSGTVDKDTMKGTAKYGDLDATWTAKREASKK